MKKLLRPLVIVVLVAVAAFAVANLSDNNNGNTNNGNETDENITVDGEQNDDGQTEEGAGNQSGSSYNYTAQPGDSYTKMARKAVQAYGDKNDTELSPAEIVAAETFLTSDAGFPQLNLSEKVELDADTVKAAVEKAQNLSDTAKARWEKYVPSVNFDTSSVGEARG